MQLITSMNSSISTRCHCDVSRWQRLSTIVLSIIALGGTGLLAGGILRALPPYAISSGGALLGLGIGGLVTLAIASYCKARSSSKTPSQEASNPKVPIERLSSPEPQKNVLPDDQKQAPLFNLEKEADGKKLELHLRTKQKKLHLGRLDEYHTSSEKISVNGKAFTLLSSSVASFDIPLFSYGLGKGREIILFDPKAKYIEYKYLQFDTFCKAAFKKLKNEKHALEILSWCAIQFLLRGVFTSSNLEKLEQYAISCAQQIAYPLVDNRPCIPMEAFMQNKRGVCRHHALVAAYFLDRFMKENQELVGTRASLQVVATEVNGGAHAWLSIVSEEGIHWCVDTLNALYGRLSNIQFQSRFKKIFGEKALNIQVGLVEERYKALFAK